MPGSGHLNSGQTLYLKLRDNAVKIDDLLISTKTENIWAESNSPTARIRCVPGGGPFPGTRAKSAALVREQFVKAQDYREKIRRAGNDKSKLPARDLAMESLVEVLDGKRVVHFHTHRHDDIMTVCVCKKNSVSKSFCSTFPKRGKSPTKLPKRRSFFDNYD
jgi:hypothetical protein